QQISEQRSSENREEGQAFLEENKEKEGVMETESGLQYKVLEEGEGVSPTAEDVVRVHYTGRLIDGTIFDTSIKEVAQANDLYNPQREPYDGAQFPLNRVISGWTEGLQLMSEGAKYEFYIPSNLAYGAQPPQGSPIGPSETLIFEVELLEVNPSEE
ncbi:MAG TPA: FKBP-type peptidyl-prolyl cis-trans isomerase, partial [Gracilimonas sp.]|uniref:FKBP-type peptidyl-prolyl cis-trans isomerase n=1 Tax=Gracilimonas sp. TaxID=1974203 RepID=UPI002DA7E248|nr:FKBP-type peptidyl-prolyl cis-trans isomerase [Gracilimonas sp.]